jgi:hypothetical protein
VIRFGNRSGTYYGDAVIVGIASTTQLTIGSTVGLSGVAIAGTTFTVSAWVKLSVDGDNAILGHCNGGPSGAGFVISNGFLRMWYYTAPWQIIDSTSGGINDGNWHYCVWSVAGTNIKMYIDNNMVDDTTLVGSINPPLNSIGCLWGPCNSDSYGPGTDGPSTQFNGQMGVVMCHSKRLSDNEVEKHWEIFKNRYDI